MAALLAPVRKNKGGGAGIINYAVTLNGRRYRVCAQHGRVLFVMLKHVHTEQALDCDGRRFREVVRSAECAHGVLLKLVQRKKGT